MSLFISLLYLLIKNYQLKKKKTTSLAGVIWLAMYMLLEQKECEIVAAAQEDKEWKAFLPVLYYLKLW